MNSLKIKLKVALGGAVLLLGIITLLLVSLSSFGIIETEIVMERMGSLVVYGLLVLGLLELLCGVVMIR